MCEAHAAGLQDYYAANAERHGWGGSRGITDQRAAVLRRYAVGPRVLDVGCSHGAYVDHLTRLGFDAIGVDFVPAFLREAGEQRRDGALVLADAHRMPFAANSFDTVLLFDVLEHMPDEEAVLREVARVAERRIVLIVPRTTDSALERHGLVFRHHLDRTHVRTYTDERAIRLFPEADVHVRTLDRVSVKHAMLSMVKPAAARLLLRLLLRPYDVSTHSEYLIVVDLAAAGSSGRRKEFAAT